MHNWLSPITELRKGKKDSTCLNFLYTYRNHNNVFMKDTKSLFDYSWGIEGGLISVTVLRVDLYVSLKIARIVQVIFNMGE